MIFCSAPSPGVRYSEPLGSIRRRTTSHCSFYPRGSEYLTPGLALPIQLRRDDVQAPQHRHHVADLMAHHQIRKDREVDERRRSRPGSIRKPTTVADHVKTQLAVARLGAAIDLI